MLPNEDEKLDKEISDYFVENVKLHDIIKLLRTEVEDLKRELDKIEGFHQKD